ncbi:MAG: hypothetical protein Unbinned2691contig1000_6 [Prokaryotic dsDNA virus sp.]|nr:MAG: hypothetical protein Unbinned2691contig1000_6 [Prokaryotic dsDNA virus sp.]|tara:strand:+ start:27810 stop:28535 length:726 start_codon:yes stop_codon:yes gene_type:complete
MSSIFGGSKQKSSSSNSSTSTAGNLAFPFLQEGFAKPGQQVYASNLQDLDGSLKSFDDYKSNIGFDFMEKLGLAKRAGNFAGGNMLQSGAALKALSEYQTGMQNQVYGDFLDKKLNLANLGAQGGQIAGSAGGYSTSSSRGTSTGSGGSSSGGLGSALGSIGAAIALSDERTKENIKLIGVIPDSPLNVYQYNYIGDTDATFVGVMAQEVEEHYPQALGPVTEEGYLTVDYDKLEEAISGS